MRTWVVIQHVAHEGPGAVAQAIAASGANSVVVRVDRGETMPPVASVSDLLGLVVMGGPMGVHDALPWLVDERALLAAAVDAGLPVLGICLGAQQLAAALGADVTTGPAPEIGVGEVHLTSDGFSDPLFSGSPASLPCMHWHGDTFSLPEGAVLLASSEAYPHQAFRVGTSAYGLQFHVEVTGALVGHWGPHLPSGVVVRTPDVAHIARSGAGIIARFVALAQA